MHYTCCVDRLKERRKSVGKVNKSASRALQGEDKGEERGRDGANNARLIMPLDDADVEVEEKEGGRDQTIE